MRPCPLALLVGVLGCPGAALSGCLRGSPDGESADADRVFIEGVAPRPGATVPIRWPTPARDALVRAPAAHGDAAAIATIVRLLGRMDARKTARSAVRRVERSADDGGLLSTAAIEHAFAGFGLEPLTLAEASADELALLVDCGCPALLRTLRGGTWSRIVVLGHRSGHDEAWAVFDGEELEWVAQPALETHAHRSPVAVAACLPIVSASCRAALCGCGAVGAVCNGAATE